MLWCVQCWGKGYHQRICKFYNLLLWNDTFYYVTSGMVPLLCTSGISAKGRWTTTSSKNSCIKEALQPETASTERDLCRHRFAHIFCSFARPLINHSRLRFITASATNNKMIRIPRLAD